MKHLRLTRGLLAFATFASIVAFVFTAATHTNLSTGMRVAALSTMSIDTSDETDSEVNSYYNGVSGLSGDSLQSALHTIIDDHTSYSYNEDVDIMKITDRDWTLSPMTSAELASWTPSDDTGSGDPYLTLLYGTNYNGTANAVKWSDDHTTVWNKEHVWAKSHGGFDTNAPAGTDLHHLIAADQGINLFHSNYDYGIPTASIVTQVDERGNATTAYRGTNTESPDAPVFEPPAEDRGDIARAIFYMATRYYVWNSVTDPKLIVVDYPTYSSSTVTSTSSDPGKMAFLHTLIEWNEEDPVSDYEIHRNNLIDNNFQHNRNPYIDHPEWVNMVFDASYSGAGASLSSGSACTIGSCSQSSGDADTLVQINLDTSATTTEFTVGDVFSSTGLIVTATMGDDSTKTVTGYTTSITDGTTLNDVGTQAVTVSYTENGLTKTASYDINVVNNSALSSISLDTSATKLNFAANTSFSSSGLIVTAHYADSSSHVVTPTSFSINGNEVDASTELTTTGALIVTVNYSEAGVSKSAQYTIKVLPLISLQATLQSDYTIIFGASDYELDFSLTGTYSDGNDSLTADIPSDSSTYDLPDTNILGIQNLNISYEGISTSLSVKVTNNGATINSGYPLATDLFFSQYIEGSSSNKVIEVFNGTGAIVDLSSYSITLYANGTTSSTTSITMSGTLADGGVYSYYNSSATSNFKAPSNSSSSGVANFNGNDALGLYKNGTLIDVIGVIGTDPGDSWTGTDFNGDSASTLNMTLVRAPTIYQPTTTFALSQWIAYPQDTSDYVGTHEFYGSSGNVSYLDQATAFANYVMTGIGEGAAGSCVTIYNELLSEYNYMDAASQSEFTSNTDTLFVNARARMDYLSAYVASVGSSVSSSDQHSKIFENIIIIGTLGISVLMGYYLLSRRKKV